MTPLPVAAAASCAVLMLSCTPAAPPSPAVPAVYVTPVSLQPAVAERRFTAVVVPRVESPLGFRTPGKVTSRLVELGQAVQRGQALARLDPGDYRLAIDAAAEQWRAATVDARQSADDAARFGRLLADGSVAAADQERLQARAEAAAARAEQARHQLDLARNRLAYTTLTAPFDGVVTAVSIEPGQVVAEGQPAIVLARADEIELAVDIPEGLAPGLPTRTARAASSTGMPIALRLRELAGSADPATRSYRARYALLDDRPEGWRLGMTTALHLTSPGTEPVADLPAAALIKTGGAPAVWLVRDARLGTLSRQPVILHAQGSDRVQVRGLDAGALVVTAGAYKLDAGMRVRPVAHPLQPPLVADVAPGVVVVDRRGGQP